MTQTPSLSLRMPNGELVATIYHVNCRCGEYHPQCCVGYTTNPDKCGTAPLADILKNWLRQHRLALHHGAVPVRRCMTEADWQLVRSALPRLYGGGA